MSSYYEGLPIFKAATDLVVMVDVVVREFPRYHKYSLGSRLREAAIDITLQIARCNRREQRERLLPEVCSRVEDLKVLVNLGKEVAAFRSFKQFVQVMEQVVGVARQAEGWRRSLPKEVTGRESRLSGPEPKRPEDRDVRR